MARQIVLDTSVVNEINRGNAGVATTLLAMKGSDQVYISQQGYNELLNGGTLADQTAVKETLRELGISVAPQGSMERRADFYKWNAVDKPSGQAKIQDGARWENQPDGSGKQLTDTHGIGNLRDAGVAAQAYALDAEIFE